MNKYIAKLAISFPSSKIENISLGTVNKMEECFFSLETNKNLNGKITNERLSENTDWISDFLESRSSFKKV